MLKLLEQIDSKCEVFWMQMLFSEEHLLGYYIQLRSLCEEKKSLYFTSLIETKKNQPIYEKKTKCQCWLRKASFVH